MSGTDTKPIKRSYLSLYFQEVFEAFVAILIVRIAMEKPIQIITTIWYSMLIGFLTFILEQYNPDFKSNVSQGISFTVGSQLMSKFV